MRLGDGQPRQSNERNRREFVRSRADAPRRPRRTMDGAVRQALLTRALRRRHRLGARRARIPRHQGRPARRFGRHARTCCYFKHIRQTKSRGQISNLRSPLPIRRNEHILVTDNKEPYRVSPSKDAIWPIGWAGCQMGGTIGCGRRRHGRSLHLTFARRTRGRIGRPKAHLGFRRRCPRRRGRSGRPVVSRQ